MAAENGKDWKEQLEEMAKIQNYAAELDVDLVGQLLGARKEEEEGDEKNEE